MGIQFAVPRNDDFSINNFGGTFREELDGSRTLKSGGSYNAIRNSGYYMKGDNSDFFPRIVIKNARGETLTSIDQPLRKVGKEWNFSITENFPYSILKDNSVSVTVSFHSGGGQYRPRYADGTICNTNCPSNNFRGLLSSNIQISSLISLVNVREESRLNNITFNEQKNSGDFNETPITDVNIINGCSGCDVNLENIIKETQNKENYMKIAGIAAAGVIGLLLYSKGGLK